MSKGLPHRTRLVALVLIVLILVVYLPFCFEPVLRPTGDDKVYIAQVVEMLRDGRWFEQTLADQPNYYKGPLFYILLRLSMMTFSVHSTLATLVPNLLAVLLGALAIFNFVAMERGPARSALAISFAAGAAFALSFGIYPFVFAAQMEVLLSAAYIGVTILMVQSIRRGTFWGVWTAIGATGWIKSPVHSALCGLALILAVIVSGQPDHLRRIKFWGAAAVGILVGLIGYLPPLLTDYDNFWATYIVRETATKGPNGVSVWASVLPVLTYFQLPFGPFLWAGMLAAFYNGHWRIGTVVRTHAVELSLVLINLLFFAWHPYRSEIYCLPLTGPLLLMAARSWVNSGVPNREHPLLAKLACGLRLAGFTTAIAFALILALPSIGIVTRMLHFDRNISDSAVMLSLGALVIFLCLLIWQRRRGAQERIVTGIVAMIPLYLAAGVLMRDLGRWDLRELRTAAHAAPDFGFWNLDHRTWSEWGAMNAWLERPVNGYHEPGQLIHALRSGATVYAPHDAALASLRTVSAAYGIDCCLAVRTVRRFRIAGGGRGIDWRSVLLKNEWKGVLAEAYVVTFVPTVIIGVNSDAQN